MKLRDQPPRLFLRFFQWYCAPKLRDYIEGDLMEVYNGRIKESGKRKADIKFIIDVLLLCRPGIIKTSEKNNHVNQFGMFKSYYKIGWRRLIRNKGYSIINIGGLAIGMTVAMFISLWIYDELSFNKYHRNYDDIAQVWRGGTDPVTSDIGGGFALQYPVVPTLKNDYPQFFKHVLISWFPSDYTVSTDDKKFSFKGQFIEGGALEMLSLKMLRGNYKSLNDQRSIVLSKSMAEALFGTEDPMNKNLRIDSRMDVQVSGIYEDIPRNNRFGEVKFFAPWALFAASNQWVKNSEGDWDNSSFNGYAQLQSNVSVDEVNAAIKDLYNKNVPAHFFTTIEKYKPFVQLIPMSTWHLYSEFQNGKPVGGRIMFVWLFGVVGIFVLLLACINFINLSTARSEKLAKEVGIRKAVGSAKAQLISQFLSESFMVVLVSFGFSVLLLTLLQTWFNELSGKDIALPFGHPYFWAIAIPFLAITGFLAGVYPALFLSSFQPVRVLKGVLRLEGFASLPRKVLVVVQFTVSVILIIGTVVVYQQVQFARNRPIGYDRNSLITVELNDPNHKGKEHVLRTELLNTGVVSGTAFSSSPLTAVWNATSGYEWPGKDPEMDTEFVICNVTLDYGKTVGLQFVAGRDFSTDIGSDSTESIIINEAAVKYMGLKNPVGQLLTDVDEFGKPKWSKQIIGVVKDMVMESPFEPARQTIYYFNKNASRLLHIKINPRESPAVALSKIKAVFDKIVPSDLFEYKFVDQEYALKFSQEERVGKLSGVFSILAIFISCLGLFGLSSFVAEQRTKEIGIRKVMGASVSRLWQMLSKDFVVLVIISCFIAVPISYYLMNSWLQKYEYRTEISLWILLLTCIVAIFITLLTVSYQAIKAAMMNPVNSLRSE